MKPSQLIAEAAIQGVAVRKPAGVSDPQYMLELLRGRHIFCQQKSPPTNLLVHSTFIAEAMTTSSEFRDWAGGALMIQFDGVIETLKTRLVALGQSSPTSPIKNSLISMAQTIHNQRSPF